MGDVTLPGGPAAACTEYEQGKPRPAAPSGQCACFESDSRRKRDVKRTDTLRGPPPAFPAAAGPPLPRNPRYPRSRRPCRRTVQILRRVVAGRAGSPTRLSKIDASARKVPGRIRSLSEHTRRTPVPSRISAPLLALRGMCPRRGCPPCRDALQAAWERSSSTKQGDLLLAGPSAGATVFRVCTTGKRASRCRRLIFQRNAAAPAPWLAAC